MRDELKNGKVKIGSWLQLASPVSGEILAKSGFEWLAVDLEHTDIEISDLTNIIRALSRYNTFPMVRTMSNDIVFIRKCLDCGAKGVIVPMINNKEQAQQAVKACKYPPQGVRGYAFVRANEWGVCFDEYALRANEEIIIIVMIETKEAVDNIDEILSVDGVDGVFIGPYDMSGSYGVPGQTCHEFVVKAKEKILKACKKHGKVAGQHIVIPTSENVKEAIAQGYTFLALGMDTVFINSGAKQALEMSILARGK